MRKDVTLEEPTFAKWLFASSGAAWIWLAARLYLGYEWLHAGWEKVTGTDGGFWTWHWAYTSESWLKSSKGLTGFVGYALTGSAKGPHSAVNYGWYAAFLRWLEHPTVSSVFAKVIPVAEITIGIALIVGLFVGVAAFFAGTLNLSFGLAGVAGVNPVFFIIEALLVLAWRNAGYIGLDHYVLPALGTPWKRGTLFHHRESGQPIHHQLA